jgi:hypothetical protein
VCTLMSVQITAVVERFLAIVTHEWLLAGVDPLVCTQCSVVAERSVAVVTYEGLLASMHTRVGT